MNSFDRRTLQNSAAQSLQEASSNPKVLILIHTGAVLAVTFGVMLVDWLLEQGIGNTGGLSGIGLRAILSTVQSIMHYAQLLILPFWQMGYTFCCLQLAKKEQVGPGSLLSGFRLFAPVLRLMLLQWAIYMALGFVCIQIASVLFAILPWFAPILQSLEAVMATGELTEAALLQISQEAFGPLMITYLAVFIPVVLPFFYQYRMTAYCLWDDPKKGAIAALRESRRMMRGNRLALAKLDLSFWWFYLLDCLILVISYGDLLLPLLGISIADPAGIHYFLFFLLYALCQLGLYRWRRNEVELTYVHAYLTLKPTLGTIVPQ